MATRRITHWVSHLGGFMPNAKPNIPESRTGKTDWIIALEHDVQKLDDF